MAANCILSEDFYVIIAMHMFYVLSLFSGCTDSNEASNLGGWERSSFGRLRGTHCLFCEWIVFRIISVQAPWASSITTEYDVALQHPFRLGVTRAVLRSDIYIKPYMSVK